MGVAAINVEMGANVELGAFDIPEKGFLKADKLRAHRLKMRRINRMAQFVNQIQENKTHIQETKAQITENRTSVRIASPFSSVVLVTAIAMLIIMLG